MRESEIGVDAEILWQAADKLRGSIDAAEYKHVVLGLIFLKYISDAFIARREKLADELKAEGIEGKQAENILEQRDEYTAENVFWVPPEARWDKIQARGKDPNLGKLIDDAMYAIEKENRKLKGKLPRDYARRGIAPERLGGLIDLIGSIAIGTDQARARDVLGRVYEYFLGKFAAAELTFRHTGWVWWSSIRSRRQHQRTMSNESIEMNRVAINPELFTWACERAGAVTFPKNK